MLDLALLADRTVRGSALAQIASSVAMMATIFLLIVHFQYVEGWSPMRAGFANMPFVVTMLAASPVSEWLTVRYGHRITCIIASVLLTAGLIGLALGVQQSYAAVVPAMVVLTLGLRVIMTVGAVALLEAVPENRTSLGTALNDVSQELGSSLGTAVVGTVLAAVAGSVLPTGAWSADFAATFVVAEQWAFLAVAGLVALVAGYGCTTLTDSHAVEED